MSKRFLFRKELAGGYRFDRETGRVDFLDENSFDDEIKKHSKKPLSGDLDYDFVFLPENPSQVALSAPLVIWHETTHACNLNCTLCGRDKSGERELSLDEINKIYKDLSSSGVFEIRLTGGEACLRKDIGEIVRAAKANGFHVSLTSNGVYSDKLRREIVNLPVGLYVLSLDGTEKIHDSIRGKGSYASTMDTIRSLVSARKNVRVNTVLMQQNKDCIEELVENLADAGVNALTLIPLRPVGSAAVNFYENKLTPKQYMDVVRRVDSLRKKHDISIATNYDIMSTKSHGANVPSHWSKMCMAGIEAACISPSGNLRACILASGEGFNVGNLNEKSLYELWHNDELWGIFRDTNRRVLEQCRNCTDYTKKCPGSCIAMTEFSKSPEEMYCFKNLIS